MNKTIADALIAMRNQTAILQEASEQMWHDGKDDDAQATEDLVAAIETMLDEYESPESLLDELYEEADDQLF